PIRTLVFGSWNLVLGSENLVFFGFRIGNMTTFHAGLAEVVRRDPRYAYEAYEFLYEALNHTQKMLGRLPVPEQAQGPEPQHHVSGQELLAVVRDLALREFGLM